MPETPSWSARLDEIASTLAALPFVDAASLEKLLKVSRRRAQQIIAPCKDPAGYYHRDVVVERLRSLVSKTAFEREVARRRKLADRLTPKEKPLWVAAPTATAEQGFPVPGVSIASRRIVVEFSDPTEALQKLLGLAMAIRNQPEAFEDMAR